MNHRDELGSFLTNLGLIGEGIEVGVAFGQNAERILNSWPGRLHLVDPYFDYPESIYKDIRCFPQGMLEVQVHAHNRLMPFSDRICWIQKPSVEAARQFVDERLDFVYIDGAHDRLSVIRDLNAWFPKVKHGGMFSGHDYENTIEGLKYIEVKSAVDEWLSAQGLKCSATQETVSPSWYLIKQ